MTLRNFNDVMIEFRKLRDELLRLKNSLKNLPKGEGETIIIKQPSAPLPPSDGGGGGEIPVLSPLIGFVINDGTPGVDIGPKLISPIAGNINQCVGVVDASDLVAPLNFEIKRGGVSVFAAPGVVGAGASPGTIFLISLSSVPLAVAKHDVFSIDIISGTSNWKFTAQLE